MTRIDETEWDFEPEYARNGAPWVRRTFGPLLGFSVEDEPESDE